MNGEGVRGWGRTPPLALGGAEDGAKRARWCGIGMVRIDRAGDGGTHLLQGIFVELGQGNGATAAKVGRGGGGRQGQGQRAADDRRGEGCAGPARPAVGIRRAIGIFRASIDAEDALTGIGDVRIAGRGAQRGAAAEGGKVVFAGHIRQIGVERGVAAGVERAHTHDRREGGGIALIGAAGDRLAARVVAGSARDEHVVTDIQRVPDEGQEDAGAIQQLARSCRRQVEDEAAIEHHRQIIRFQPDGACARGESVGPDLRGIAGVGREGRGGRSRCDGCCRPHILYDDIAEALLERDALRDLDAVGEGFERPHAVRVEALDEMDRRLGRDGMDDTRDEEAVIGHRIFMLVEMIVHCFEQVRVASGIELDRPSWRQQRRHQSVLATPLLVSAFEIGEARHRVDDRHMHPIASARWREPGHHDVPPLNRCQIRLHRHPARTTN